MVDDGWISEHGYTISSPCETDGSVKLRPAFFEKRYICFFTALTFLPCGDAGFGKNVNQRSSVQGVMCPDNYQ